MSKTKGNVIDPLDLINTYGTDALRFTLAALAAPGRDVKFSTAQVEGYRNFATKLWNAARFAEMNECVFNPHFSPSTLKNSINQWIVTEITTLTETVEDALKAYKFNEAAHALYHFIWGTFCDWYLEFCKPKFASAGEEKEETQQTVAWILDQVVRLLHPFMPYITEALWQNLQTNQGLLMGEDWPDKKGPLYPEACQDIQWLIQVITEVRSIRAEMNVPASSYLTLAFYDAHPDTHRKLRTYEDLLLKLGRLHHIKVSSSSLSQEEAVGGAQTVIKEATLLIPLKEAIDIQSEKVRLQKEKEKAFSEIQGLEKKLSNSDFITRAPQDVIQTQKSRLETANQAHEKLEQALRRLGEV